MILYYINSISQQQSNWKQPCLFDNSINETNNFIKMKTWRIYFNTVIEKTNKIIFN